eukprot:5566684-Prymnesium_polylepis.1
MGSCCAQKICRRADIRGGSSWYKGAARCQQSAVGRARDGRWPSWPPSSRPGRSGAALHPSPGCDSVHLEPLQATSRDGARPST